MEGYLFEGAFIILFISVFTNISWKRKGIKIWMIAPPETNSTHSTLITTNNFQNVQLEISYLIFHNFLWWYRLIFLCYLMKKWSNRWDLTILKRWKMTRGKLWVSDANFVNANSTILMPKRCTWKEEGIASSTKRKSILIW